MKLPHITGKRIIGAFGIVGILISLYFLVSGAIYMFGNSTARDSEGFYRAWDLRINQDSCAMLMKPESVLIAPGRESSFNFSTFKIEGQNNNPSNPVFLGIAEKSDIDAYLNGIEYDKIVDIYMFPSRAGYKNFPGSSVPESPASQTFWIESSSGTGMQHLTWELKPDCYLLIMNEDGSPGIDMNLVLGVKSPLIYITGVNNLSLGAIILLISILILAFSGKSRNSAFPQPLS